MMCEHNNTVGRVDIYRNGKKIGETWRCGVCGEVSNDMMFFVIPFYVPGTSASQ